MFILYRAFLTLNVNLQRHEHTQNKTAQHEVQDFKWKLNKLYMSIL